MWSLAGTGWQLQKTSDATKSSQFSVGSGQIRSTSHVSGAFSSSAPLPSQHTLLWWAHHARVLTSLVSFLKFSYLWSASQGLKTKLLHYCSESSITTLVTSKILLLMWICLLGMEFLAVQYGLSETFLTSGTRIMALPSGYSLVSFCSLPMAGGQNWMISKVPPNHSVIPWFCLDSPGFLRSQGKYSTLGLRGVCLQG